jgi:hypothetical protein
MSASPLLAYHGDPEVKRQFLARVRAHVKADQLMQGYGYWKDGKGCAVGCTVHLDSSGTAHQAYPRELGIPEELAYLEDHLFESLDVKRARAWPAQFLSAITPGADLSRVYDRWSAWNLIDPVDGVITLVTDDFPDVQRIVRETGAACEAGDVMNAVLDALQAMREAAQLISRLRDELDELHVLLAGVVGLVQLVSSRNDLPAGLKEILLSNHRFVDALTGLHAEAAEAAWAAGAARAAYYVRAADKLIELLKAAS